MSEDPNPPIPGGHYAAPPIGGADRIIPFSRLKLALLAAPFVALVGLSVYLNPDGWSRATGPIVGIAAVAVLWVLALLFMPRMYYIHLSPEALTIHYVGRPRTYSWGEVHSFRAVGNGIDFLPLGNKVVFNLAAGSPHRSVLQKAAGAVLGYDQTILATFTVGATELATVLNEWQRRYGAIG